MEEYTRSLILINLYTGVGFIILLIVRVVFPIKNTTPLVFYMLAAIITFMNALRLHFKYQDGNRKMKFNERFLLMEKNKLIEVDIKILLILYLLIIFAYGVVGAYLGLTFMDNFLSVFLLTLVLFMIQYSKTLF